MNFLKFFRRKERKIADDMRRIPNESGYTDVSGNVTFVSVAVLQGMDVCWGCGDPMNSDNFYDFPLNNGGSLCRMHKKCGRAHIKKHGIKEVAIPQREDPEAK